MRSVDFVQMSFAVTFVAAIAVPAQGTTPGRPNNWESAACLAHATERLLQRDPAYRGLQFDGDGLVIERTRDQVGSQSVSTVVTGTGSLLRLSGMSSPLPVTPSTSLPLTPPIPPSALSAPSDSSSGLSGEAPVPGQLPSSLAPLQSLAPVQPASGPVRSKEVRFLCLLADDGAPVFVHLSANPAPSSLRQCKRQASVAGPATACLQDLLAGAEGELAARETVAIRRLRGIEDASNRDAATRAFQESDRAWHAYRDAECRRRSEMAAAGVAPEVVTLACIIDLNRARIAELAE
jgi:uncharacterized protein YecT (DUF1311 family)